MMDKSQLLQAFQSYLDSAGDDFDNAGQGADLYTLLSEMAALRNEVKTESRQFKGALEEFRGVFETLQASHDTLDRALDRSATECRKQNREMLRGLLLDMLDIYDRMEAGLDILQNYAPPGFWGRAKHQAFVDSLREGQGMTLRRFLQVLARYRTLPIETLGRPLDPHTMRAVESVCDPAFAHNSVVEELRKGFIWEDEVLRPAEVRANNTGNLKT
jgi:molecular chaperone GrpE